MDTDSPNPVQKLESAFTEAALTSSTANSSTSSATATTAISSTTNTTNTTSATSPTANNLSAFANSLYYFDPAYDGPLVYVHPFGYVSLFSLIRQQLEYYFSVDNLVRDVYLRSQMNSHGYVSISIITAFNRIRSLVANDETLVLIAARTSPLLKVKNNSVRVRQGWKSWVFPQQPKTNENETNNASTDESLEAESSEEEFEYENENDNENEDFVQEQNAAEENNMQQTTEDEDDGEDEQASASSEMMQHTQTV